MTIYSETGLSIKVYEAVPIGQAQLFDLTDEITSLRWQLLADGGYWSATISIAGTQNEIEGWIADGLGRRIVIYNAAAQVRGEYFVNGLSASVGTRGIRIGPLLSAPNRVRVAYAPKDISVSPPVVGSRTILGPINNTVPQARYGVIERLLSGGEMTDADVTQFYQTFLAEYARPVSSEEIKLSGGGAPTVTLELAGYIQWMNAYTYTNTASGSVSLDARLAALLAACPNGGIFSTDYSLITPNPTTVEQYTNENKTAYALMKEAVARGDLSYRRYTFGIYNGRRAVYAPLPTLLEYLHEITAPDIDITRATGRAVVDPWDVLPGTWVFDPDFLIGRSPETVDIRQDPRNVFIESASFSAPYDLALNGSRVSTFTLPQMMAAMGISGLGGA